MKNKVATFSRPARPFEIAIGLLVLIGPSCSTAPEPRPSVFFEMRAVTASGADEASKALVRAEREILCRWLGTRRHKMMVLANPDRIDVFNRLRRQSGSPLMWLPRIASASRSLPAIPDFVGSLLVHEIGIGEADSPGAEGQGPVELVAVDRTPVFTNRDLDVAACSRDGGKVELSVRPERRKAFEALTGSVAARGGCMAEILNGRIISLPLTVTAIPGNHLYLVLSEDVANEFDILFDEQRRHDAIPRAAVNLTNQ